MYIVKKINFKILSLGLIVACFSGLLFPAKTNAIYETYQGVTYYEGTWIGPIGQEVDATGWSAAKVIYHVSQWYGINPQVLLATLQKESSLVTNGSPPFYLPMWAMGYAYTEGGIVAACGTSTNNNPTGSCAGFAMQMDWAGGSLASWQKSTTSTYRPRNPLYLTVAPNYNTSQWVTPANGSTAALYRYTPHITYPNTFCNIFATFGWDPGTGANYCNNPAFVIDDSVFTNKNSMSEAQIQNFLATRGSYLANYTVPSDDTGAVYRFYNISNGTHFYTASASERDRVGRLWGHIYRYEGAVYNLTNNGQNVIQLYRFWNTNGTHFYTSSPAERDNIVRRWGNTYKYEGVAYYVAVSGSPVYRFYNISNGTHFYTASAEERDRVGRLWGNIYRYEGTAYYIQ